VGRPTGRVGEHDVDAARRCGRDRVERDGRRIAAGLRDHRDVVAARPDFELLARRRAERVAGGEQHRMALRLQPFRELADRRRFARAVHSCDHDHVRPLIADRKGLLERLQEVDEGRAKQRARVRIAARAPVARLQVLDQERRGGDADVGAEQRALELLECLVVERAAPEDAGQRAGEPLARCGESAGEPIGPRWPGRGVVGLALEKIEHRCRVRRDLEFYATHGRPFPEPRAHHRRPPPRADAALSGRAGPAAPRRIACARRCSTGSGRT
jgi:hypothetical protein